MNQHVFTESDGSEWIVKERDKNGNRSELPFFPEARKILDECNGTLPIITNQRYNKYIKEVAKMLGHTTTFITQTVYARIQRKRIKLETQKLINKKTA